MVFSLGSYRHRRDGYCNVAYRRLGPQSYRVFLDEERPNNLPAVIGYSLLEAKGNQRIHMKMKIRCFWLAVL